MYTPFVRLLIGLGGLLAAYDFNQRGSTAATYLTLVAVVLVVWGYFRNGTVALAFGKIKKQDFTTAESVLRQTRFPEFLKKEQQGFYHFTLGFIEANKNNSEEAYKQFKDALKFGVKTENNVALINLNLAEIEADRGNVSQAKAHLHIARALKYDPKLEDEISRIDSKINNKA